MKNLSILIFFLSICSNMFSQQTDTLEISTIPFPLFFENVPLAYSIKDNSLRLIAPAKTDMFRDPNATYNTDNAPKLLFKPDDSFVLSAAIEHKFVTKWDGGAIILKSDSINWVKFCFEKDYTGAKRVVSVVTKDISDDCNSVSIEQDKVYFKMAKADNVITLYYSADGSKWFLVRHLRFNAKPGFSIGFLAQSPEGRECNVRFSDIRYESKKIKDPYLGE